MRRQAERGGGLPEAPARFVFPIVFFLALLIVVAIYFAGIPGVLAPLRDSLHRETSTAP
jgi:hypothetical protein